MKEDEVKKEIVFSIAIIVLVLATPLVYSQTSTQDEMVTVPKSQLTAQQLQSVQQQQMQQRIDRYGKWVGLGKEVGTAVDSSLTSLTDQAERFSKTGVGKFTMFIIAWKVLGADLIQVLIGIPLLAIGFCVWVWSFRKNCLPYRELVSEKDGEKTYETKEPDEEQQWSHFIVLLIWIVLCMFVIFM